MKRNNLKGYWLEDEFLSLVKGHTAFEATYRDGRQFFVEIDRVGNNLFPIGEDEKYLFIRHSNSVVEKDLNEYFISQHSRYRDRLYGNHFHLGNFFNDIMQQLAIYGECYYAIDWDVKQIEDRTYHLPTDLRYLRTSTMSVKKNDNGSIVGYKQQYSPFAKLSYDPDEKKTRRFNFKKDEVFYTIYPLERVHPVKKSMSLLKPILRFWDFGLDRGESNVHPQSKRFNVVWAGQQRYSDQKRKYALTRAKVRRNFHYLLNIDDLTITEYYDIFLVTRYKKELNEVRQYFIDEFNKQVFTAFTHKNTLEQIPRLELIGFMTNDQIDEYFEKYKRKEVTSKEFINKIVNTK